MSQRPKPVVLVICDGWGVAPDGEGNAIAQSKTPNFKKFVSEYPVMTLHASGNEVGLMFGEMGNSEVGHLNIGGGRVCYQTLPRINKNIEDGDFFKNKALLEAMDKVKKNKSALHLMGLVGPGHVHSNTDHLYALLELAKKEKVKQVYLHLFLDGRDAPYNSGIDFIHHIKKKIKEYGRGEIASISGRFYAMDRDNRWDRVEKAYKAIALGQAVEYYKDPVEAVETSYKKEVYDEEFIPTVIGAEGKPTATVNSGDACIFFNFRPDRARELTKAFILPGFSKFKREYTKDITFVTMTEYEKELPVVVAYSPQVLHNGLSEAISREGLKQFHIAETEKYAHVTFFFNGTIEDPFPGEDRKIVSSPKVSSYDQQPEMSAPEVAREVVKAIESEKYDAIIVNFANTDMVGHCGKLKPAIKACEAVDKVLGQVADHVLAKDGVLLITADHGNAEEVKNLQTGEKSKEHSTNPVPFIIIGNKYRGEAGPAGDPPEGDLSLLQPVGMLADIAPTMLKIMKVSKPKEMTGRALL